MANQSYVVVKISAEKRLIKRLPRSNHHHHPHCGPETQVDLMLCAVPTNEGASATLSDEHVLVWSLATFSHGRSMSKAARAVAPV